MRSIIRFLPILAPILFSYFITIYLGYYIHDAITSFYILSLITFSTLITQKYEKSYSEDFIEFSNPFIKSYSILLAILYISNFLEIYF